MEGVAECVKRKRSRGGTFASICSFFKKNKSTCFFPSPRRRTAVPLYDLHARGSTSRLLIGRTDRGRGGGGGETDAIVASPRRRPCHYFPRCDFAGGSAMAGSVLRVAPQANRPVPARVPLDAGDASDVGEVLHQTGFSWN